MAMNSVTEQDSVTISSLVRMSDLTRHASNFSEERCVRQDVFKSFVSKHGVEVL
jgi:hypothetical protein